MISAKIKELIENRKVSQTKLAKHIGITPGCVSNYLKGRRKPDFATLIKIALYLQVDLNYFVNDDFDEPFSRNSGLPPPQSP